MRILRIAIPLIAAVVLVVGGGLFATLVWPGAGESEAPEKPVDEPVHTRGEVQDAVINSIATGYRDRVDDIEAAYLGDGRWQVSIRAYEGRRYGFFEVSDRDLRVVPKNRWAERFIGQ